MTVHIRNHLSVQQSDLGIHMYLNIVKIIKCYVVKATDKNYNCFQKYESPFRTSKKHPEITNLNGYHEFDNSTD